MQKNTHCVSLLAAFRIFRHLGYLRLAIFFLYFLLIWDLVQMEQWEEKSRNCGPRDLAQVKMMGRYWDIGQASCDERRHVCGGMTVTPRYPLSLGVTFLRSPSFPPRGSGSLLAAN